MDNTLRNKFGPRISQIEQRLADRTYTQPIHQVSHGSGAVNNVTVNGMTPPAHFTGAELPAQFPGARPPAQFPGVRPPAQFAGARPGVPPRSGVSGPGQLSEYISRRPSNEDDPRRRSNVQEHPHSYRPESHAQSCSV